MITITNLSLEFGSHPLFENISFIINEKDRIALVGKNGAGKSTLLKIIAQQQEISSGIISRQKDITIGYLPQVMKLSNSHTILEEVEQSFSEIKSLEKIIEKEKQELENRTDYDSDDYLELLNQFSHHNERFSLIGGNNYHATIERTLLGLGFTHTDFNRPTKEFSGGWRMRIELAKILMQNPDLLLLDEPTNHLDIESIGWLEKYIKNSNKAIVLVSHDKAFINNITNRTLEISCGRLYDYKVKYDAYLELRQERREQQIKAYENQKKEIEEIKKFIDQFRYKPSKSAQVQSRIKYLEKIIPIEIDEIDTSKVNLKFKSSKRSGDYTLICESLSKNYGNHKVLDNIDLSIKRGEKVAFVGKNGEGKSTMIKCIMQEIDFNGKLKLGHNVDIGYFAQNQAQLLNEDLTIFETIDNVAKGDIRFHINDILGAFMFGGEIAQKKVKVLSGGERTRLAMIKLLLDPVNFLILDEPTNHLDIRTKDILKKAILNFDGTVIIVSHDRDFLNGLVTRTYEFKDKKLREHIGGIYDYLKIKEEEDNNNSKNNIPLQEGIDYQNNKINSGKNTYKAQQEKSKLKRKIQDTLKKIEEQISYFENRQNEIETLLSKDPLNIELTTEYGEIIKQLNLLMEDWEQEEIKLTNIK